MKVYQLLLQSSFVVPCQYTNIYYIWILLFFSLKFSLSLGNLLLPSQRKFKDHKSSVFAPWFSFYSLVFPFTAFKAVLKLVIVSSVSFHFSLSHSAPSALCLAPASFLFTSQSLVLSSHLSPLVSWCSFLLLFTARQSRHFLKSSSLFWRFLFNF